MLPQPGPTAPQPGFGAPQPDPYAYAPLPQGGGYGFGPPPQRGGTNGFAVVGLVLGILPVLAGILGIVFGAIGLRQIKRTGQDGRGMALAGVILGSIWLVLIAVLIVVAVTTGSDSDDSSSAGLPGLFSSASPSPGSSASPEAEEADAFDVKVGNCLPAPPKGEVKEVDVLPCSTPHKVEAYASFTLPGKNYPGESAVTGQAESGCASRFAAFVGKSYDASALELYYLHPTSQSWSILDDREVVCLVGSPTPVTGSLRNARK